MPTIKISDGVEIYYKDWGPKEAQPIVFPSRLAAQFRRLGQSDDVLPRSRLPRDCA